ncbi:MAG: hypothetical protein ABEH38_07720, partial [Flavobacteriales bacterium]
MDDHFTLWYEELLKDPESVMQDLAKKLALSFDPVLLKPTFLGREWKGNRASGEELKGFSSDRKDAWKEEISPVELCLVNRGLGDLIDASGYKKVRGSKGFWKRQKGEALKTYISNRLMKNYL